MNYKTLIGDTSIRNIQKSLGANTWPEFMQHDDTVDKYWPDLYTDFLNFQFALYDNDEVVGVGNTTHLYWQGAFTELPKTGFDWAMGKASNDFAAGIKSNVLVGLQILINPKYQSKGISYQMLEMMKDIARTNGMTHVALPVRPTLKCNYPLIPMERYINWQNKNNLPFDPWIRVHIKAGGKITGICDKSMTITGTVAEWEKWSGLSIPDSGDYVVNKALVPVNIDKENNIGRYIEPNVWVVHEV